MVLLFNVVVETEGCLSVCMCAFLFRPSGRPAHLPAFVPQRVQSTKRNVNMAHGMVGGGSGSQQTEARIRTGWFPVDVDVGVGSVIVTIIFPLASLLLLLLLTTRQRRQCAANYDQKCNHHHYRSYNPITVTTTTMLLPARTTTASTTVIRHDCYCC